MEGEGGFLFESEDTMRSADKVAIITGASQGDYAGICRRFCKRGARSLLPTFPMEKQNCEKSG